MIPEIATMGEVNPDSSVSLLLKAQIGDGDALNQLLARYLPRLRRYASRRLPSALRTMSDSGDLVQDAIISALPHVNTLEIRSEDAFQRYLKRAVRNRINDLHKKARRRPARKSLPDDVPERAVSPYEQAKRNEALERYKRALASLRPSEREAIRLRVELGLDYKEIATRMKKASVDAARMFVTRALVHLADEMDRQNLR